MLTAVLEQMRGARICAPVEGLVLSKDGQYVVKVGDRGHKLRRGQESRHGDRD